MHVTHNSDEFTQLKLWPMDEMSSCNVKVFTLNNFKDLDPNLLLRKYMYTSGSTY